MTEESGIVHRVLCGDTDSFRWLVERYAGRVKRIVGGITGSPDACEDLVQDVFLAVYANLATFDPGKSRLSTWLFTIARNKAVNAVRRKRPAPVACLPERIDAAGPDDAAASGEFLAALDRHCGASNGRGASCRDAPSCALGMKERGKTYERCGSYRSHR